MPKKKSKIIPFEDGPKIEEPEEIRTSLDAAREALGIPHLKFDHSFLRGELISVLDGNGAVQTLLEDRQHPVLPLLDSHWLGLQLKFRTTLSQAEIRSASMIVLKGEAYESKVPLLRAEWERATDDESRAHAQPHWHVYMSLVGFSQSLPRITLAPQAEPWAYGASQTGQQTWTGGGLGKFHLAMAAQWHDGGSHYCEPTAAGLGHWIRGCIVYTRQQLTYVSRKARLS
ncbi:MAG TPA: hypothetical protein VGM86_19630 [Thermoanaerobaculia bacterium]|jgi:hypothetical protein